MIYRIFNDVTLAFLFATVACVFMAVCWLISRALDLIADFVIPRVWK